MRSKMGRLAVDRFAKLFTNGGKLTLFKFN